MPDYSRFSLLNALVKFAIDLPESYHLPLSLTRDLVNDTRVLRDNDIFCAVIGNQQDGRDYIDQAIKLGAAVVLTECTQARLHGEVSRGRVGTKTAVVIQFYQLNQHLFSLCQAYYQSPQKEMTVIGITGTNGKTSTCQLIARLLENNQQSCAIIGTLGAGQLDHLTPLNNTTPGATELHYYFNQFRARKIANVAMEVSSHALAQGRIHADILDIAVFTNLSRDHLDYHQTMSAYAEAKQRIFTGNSKQIAVVNGDDKQAQTWLAKWPDEQQVIVFGRHLLTNVEQSPYPYYVAAKNIRLHNQGVEFLLATHLGEQRVSSPLLGSFNIDNLLAAVAALLAKGLEFSAICQAIRYLTPVTGRMEAFSGAQQTTAVVDYAHTPDALANALDACREHCQGQLWLVFGCGGDRDQGKRPLMGKIAENKADHIVITNDNPRNEAPELIVNDILAGCQCPEKIAIILDRKQAVLATLAQAKADDIVLFAGKGHEDYIIIGSKKLHYDERALVQVFFQQQIKNNNNEDSL